MKVFLSEDKIKDLPEDSTAVFKPSMIDRYIDRPNARFKDGAYKVVDSLCFADFLAHYFVDYSSKDDNDFQPKLLQTAECEEFFKLAPTSHTVNVFKAEA